MKKRSGRIVTLLAALSTAVALSVSTFAAVPDQEPDLILKAAQTQERNSGENYIRILSPSDGEAFYQGKEISYSVNVSGCYSDYMTRPYITFVLETPTKNWHVKDYTFPKDLADGEKGIFKGTIETERLSPGTYYFGVMNWPSRNGTRLTQGEVKNENVQVPLLAVEIEIKEHSTHIWDSGKVTKPETCTEAGEKTFTCTLCGKTRTEAIPAGHIWNSGSVIVAPDVGEAGVITYTCKRCKAKKTEKIPPLKATIKKVPASVKVKAAKKGSLTVSWKKLSNAKKDKKLLKQIKAIQIQYSTDSKFKKNRKSWTIGKKKTSVSLQKLKRKTTYYVRVRYIGNGSASKWSKTKRVKTR